MEKVNKTFEKGMSSDFSELKQPVGTYPYAKNIIRDVQGTVKSERGTTLLAQLSDFTDVTIIGETVIGDEIIFFLTSDEGSSIIKLQADNTIKKILHTGPGFIPSVVEQSYLMVRHTEPEITDIKAFTNAEVKMTFSLIEPNVVKVQRDYSAITGGGSYPQVVNPFINNYSSIVLPEALWPITSQTYRNDLYDSGGPSVSINVKSTDGLVGMIQTGSLGNLDFTFDSFTYEAIGIPFNTIDTDVLNFSTPIDAVSRKNYKGEIIIYWTDDNNVPRRLNTASYIDSSNFDDETRLFLNPSLPQVTNVETVEGGGVTSGLYNFAVRLGTATGNVTTFSQISEGYPVVDGVQLGGKLNYDGAPPQTPAGKTLKVTVSDIDNSYDFIELVMITYVGEANLLEAHIVGKKTITNTSVIFEYYSENQKTEEILLESLVEDAIEYNTAKNILQKDNHLFLSNLTTQGFEGLDVELQDFANQIEIHFTEKLDLESHYLLSCETEHWSSGVVADWDQGVSYFATSGAQRDHSFRLKETSAGTFSNYKNPDYTYRYKGYQRDEVYSFAFVPIFTGNVYGAAYHIPGDSDNFSTQSIKGTEFDTRLRGWKNNDGTYHHRMPSTTKSKPYYNTSGYDITKILGIELKNIDVTANSVLAKQLIGYTIVRQRRNRPGNGIITMQGIANVFNDTLQSSTINPGAFLGKTRFIRRLVDGGTTEYLGPGLSQDVSDKYFLFHSPDQEHGLITDDYLAGVSSVEEVGLREIRRYCDNRVSGLSTEETIVGAWFQTIDDLSSNVNYDLSGMQDEQTLDKAVHIPITGFDGNTTVSIGLPGGKSINSTGMMGGVVLARASGKIHREYTNGNYVTDVRTFSSNPDPANEYKIYERDQVLEIYNILSHTNNVYGDLSSAEYIKVEERYIKDSPGSEVIMYGGDTFLSDYFFTLGNRQIIDYRRTAAEAGLSTRTNVNTIIETKGNYEYRHYVEDTIDGDTNIPGTLPYFPKYRELLNYQPSVSEILGIWNQELSKGTPNAYNKHYNFENTLNKYYPRDSFIDIVSNFPNRIIYSLASFENEQFDSYRTFLINNYHDIPKETGEITNMFEYNNILYAHTPHSLWRTYVNEKTFTNTTSGDVVLGNGGLFPMPSDQTYTEEGGFAGTSAKWGCTNTPYGRLFIDDHQGKVFLLVGNKGVQEISDPLMFEFFANTLTSTNAETYKIGYDPLYKRAIISLDTDLSISYGFELQSWSSFHSYQVDRFATRDNKLIATKAGTIYEMSTGNYGEAFGVDLPSQLNIVINEGSSITKEFNSIKWIQRYEGEIFNNILIKSKELTTGNVIPSLVTSFADEQNFLPLGEQHVHSIGGEHRMTIPPDNNPSVVYDNDLFRPTIKGKYSVIELTYLPETNPLELEYFSVEFLKVAE